ncbi:7TM domain-containing protein [Pseudohaliea sp.]|uniref:7TM domain-containing protein n=1 Tax=Pseudohaliea sp. TaxID=2740289 RepID=UPI0032EC1F5C
MSVALTPAPTGRGQWFAGRLRAQRPRNGLRPHALALLVVAAVLPLSAMALRILALSGSAGPAATALGAWLNDHLTLHWVPAVDRDTVLHIVMLPLAALLVALTRLSLGVRVLGFRAILIAIGMQEIGVLPSLLLIAIIALTVVLVRPFMRASGMPLYARVATILTIVAATMVTGLLFGAHVDSSMLTSFAFFPVVILAMLAESIADTVARESTAMAAWRTSATILLAMAIAALASVPALRELTLACPELIVTQLALTVLVSEFMDWRLLEDFRPGAAAVEAEEGLSVAVVRNRWNKAVLAHDGSEPPRRYRLDSVQPLVDALRSAGHRVAVIEADARLYQRLRSFFGTRPPDRARVINCAGGVQGTGRLCQVPAYCEMIGVPYSGPDPLAMASLSDRLQLFALLERHGLSAPAVVDMTSADQYQLAPLLVHHRFQGDREPLHAATEAALERARKQVLADGDTPLFTRQPGGRRLHAVVLAGEQSAVAPRVLPLLERRSRRGGHRPAGGLAPVQRDAAEDAAARAFAILRCRDFARVDLAVTEEGEVTIEAVRAVDLFTPRGALAVAAAAAGIEYATLVQSLLRPRGGNPQPIPLAALSALQPETSAGGLS